MKNLLLVLFLITSINCFAQSPEALKYIKDNANPIDTNLNNPGNFDFLKPLLAGNRVIGMGEATHGTHQFQAAKMAIFKYLVTNLNYKLFGIEANFTKCQRVNDYVLNGKGDPKAAVAGMAFWMWQTKEILDLVEWMHSYNQDKPQNQKVKFYGFDMQYDTYIIPQLAANLKKLDSTYYKEHFSKLRSMNVARAKLSGQQRDSIKLLLKDLTDYVDSHQNELSAVLSKDEAAYTKHDIRLLEQCLDLNDAATSIHNRMAAINDTRDKYMCENIRWILDHEGSDSKIALWAHNLHIAKTTTSRGAMGSYLKDFYKDNYYALGFDFNKGGFRAGNMQERKITTFNIEAKKASSGNIFSILGLPAFFIDVNKAAKADTKGLFTKKIEHLAVGDAYTSEFSAYLKDAFADMYDGLIFFNETTGTLPVN